MSAQDDSRVVELLNQLAAAVRDERPGCAVLRVEALAPGGAVLGLWDRRLSSESSSSPPAPSAEAP